MSFYQKHLFFCVNRKESGAQCCGSAGSADLCEYARNVLKKREIHGQGSYRVSNSGCLGRCKLGPCLVIYPDNIWYRCETTQDVDRIIEQHVLEGGIVDDLLIDAEVRL